MTPFMSIRDCNKHTGLSMSYLRTGCKNKTIPHIMVGDKYMIDVEGLFELVRLEARANMWEGVDTNSLYSTNARA